MSSTQPTLNDVNLAYTPQRVQEMINDFRYMDLSLFDNGSDGPACGKKFSNNGTGLAKKVIDDLELLADAILTKKFHPKDYGFDSLLYMDALTILSNHIDQQRTGDKLPNSQRKAYVLKFLQAANAVSPLYGEDLSDLRAHSVQALSSQAIMLNYFGKAERYSFDETTKDPENRLPKLLEALRIAEYLKSLNLSYQEDPHQYEDRVPTFRIVANYALQDLKRFDEAKELLTQNLLSASPYNLAQTYNQLAYCLQAEFKHLSQEEFNRLHGQELKHYVEAAKACAEGQPPLIQANVFTGEMMANLTIGKTGKAYDSAVLLAQRWKNDGRQDFLKEGIKEQHLKAADEVLEETEDDYTLNTFFNVKTR